MDTDYENFINKTLKEMGLTDKQYKEHVIKETADEYKQKYSDFPQKLYNAMYNYNVLITD